MPSDESLQKEGIRLSKTTQKRIELIKYLRPQQVKIFKEDLDRLRAIGAGEWMDGFYRVLSLARHCWLLDTDLAKLIKLGNGNAREGLVYAIKVAEKEQNAQNK